MAQCSATDSRDHRDDTHRSEHHLGDDHERTDDHMTDSTSSNEPAVAELLLGPALRYVSETEATVWVETTAPCTVRVLDTSTRTFEVAGHHYALVILEGLAPASKIPYQV